MFFSVNYHYFLRDLRVSVVKWPFFSRLKFAFASFPRCGAATLRELSF